MRVMMYNTLTPVHSFLDSFKWTHRKVESNRLIQRFKDALFKCCLKWGFVKQEVGEASVRVQQVETKDIFHLIEAQMHALIRDGQRPAQVILGYTHLDMLRMDRRTYYEFPINYKMDGRVMGLTVRCVPYIDGCFVLPEDKNYGTPHQAMVQSEWLPEWRRAYREFDDPYFRGRY